GCSRAGRPWSSRTEGAPSPSIRPAPPTLARSQCPPRPWIDPRANLPPRPPSSVVRAARAAGRPAGGSWRPTRARPPRPGHAASALGLEHRPGAVLRAPTAAPELGEIRGLRFVEHDAVVVGQLLARADVAQGDDEDLVLLRAPLRVFLDLGLAVRIAAVVDPARDVAADVRVDHVMVVEREQEGVAVFVLVAVFLVDLVVGTQLAAVLDDALALPDRRDGEDAVAVDRGLAGFDLLFLHLGRGRGNGTPIVARAAFDTRPRPRGAGGKSP